MAEDSNDMKPLPKRIADEDFDDIAIKSTLPIAHPLLCKATHMQWDMLIDEKTEQVLGFGTQQPVSDPTRAARALRSAMRLSNKESQSLRMTKQGHIQILINIINERTLAGLQYADLSSDFQAGLPGTGRHR